MGVPSPSQEHNISIISEIQPSFAAVNDEREGASPAHVISVEGSSKRRIHKVPPQLRGENNQSIYDPVVLSIGPYHHGKQQFRRLEKFKDEVLNDLVQPSDRKMLLRGKILKQVERIKSHYEEVEYDEEKWDEEKWAEMILRDTCFLIYYMDEKNGETEEMQRRLGLSTTAFLDRDFYKVENQIPLWIIRFVLKLIQREDGEAVLCKFIGRICSEDIDRLTALPHSGDHEREPLHLLEAIRAVRVGKEPATEPITEKKLNSLDQIMPKRKGKWSSNDICPALKWANFPVLFATYLIRKRKKRSSSSNKSQEGLQKDNFPFRSVTELQAKGIYFKPSSRSLKDLKFETHSCYGVLRLPICFVSENSKVFYSNIIAYELSPETNADGTVISYFNFMKSLIENPKDVKELRRKGILFSNMGNDEEVVKVFREIDTYGADNAHIFLRQKNGIEDHCNSKAKTWMAEFFHTYFRSPCTVIALVAAALVVCLTVLQTYYTIPSSKVKPN